MRNKLFFRIVSLSLISFFGLFAAPCHAATAETPNETLKSSADSWETLNPVLKDPRIVTSSVAAANGDRINVITDWTNFRGPSSETQFKIRPLFGFGRHKEAFVQFDLPVKIHKADDAVFGGLDGLGTRLAWVYYRKNNMTQSASFKVISPTNTNKHIAGRTTVLNPEWATTYVINDWFALTGVVSYAVSVHQDEGTEKINQLTFKPVPTFLLPKQCYFFVEPDLAWNFHDGRLEPLIRPTIGKVFGKNKNLDINAFFEAPLTNNTSKKVELFRTGVEVIWYF